MQEKLKALPERPDSLAMGKVELERVMPRRAIIVGAPLGTATLETEEMVVAEVTEAVKAAGPAGAGTVERAVDPNEATSL